MQLTLKGRTAIELIRRAGVDLLTSPEMTGQWERRLYQISKGEAGQDKFMENVKKFTLSIIEKCVCRLRLLRMPLVKMREARGRAEEPLTNQVVRPRVLAKRQGHHQLTQLQAKVRLLKRVLQVLVHVNCLLLAHHLVAQAISLRVRRDMAVPVSKKDVSLSSGKNTLAKITSTMLKSLVEKGSTQVLSFKRKDGSTVKARIILKDVVTGQLSGEKQEA